MLKVKNSKKLYCMECGAKLKDNINIDKDYGYMCDKCYGNIHDVDLLYYDLLYTDVKYVDAL